MSKKITVVVSSCDAFHDCWAPLSASFRRFFPMEDCRIVLLSNFLVEDIDGIEVFPVGEDRGWADNLRLVVETLDCEYLLYLQEDYWLVDPVSGEALLRHIEHMEKSNIDYLRLTFPNFDSGRSAENPDYCAIPAGVPYRLCLQAALWKKSTLMQLLLPGWSGWDFECRIEKFIKDEDLEVRSEVLHSSCRPALSIEYVTGTGVRKGRWTRPAVKYLRDNGFADLIPLRPVEGVLLDFLAKKHSPLFRLPCRILGKIIKHFHWNI